MCNICLAHPPNTCLCNGYEETNHASTQFYFLALFKMEQMLEYLSHGKFQYCNICFCRLKILQNSCFVCLLEKKKKHFIWKCGRCYQSLCGCYSFCNDSPISTIHHAPWGVTLLLDVRLYKFTTFTLLFPLTTELLLPACIVPAFTSFSAKEWLECAGRERRQLLVSGKEAEDMVEGQSKGWEQSTSHRCQGEEEHCGSPHL